MSDLGLDDVDVGFDMLVRFTSDGQYIQPIESCLAAVCPVQLASQ